MRVCYLMPIAINIHLCQNVIYFSPSTLITFKLLSHHQAKVEEQLREEIAQRKRTEHFIEKQKQDMLVSAHELTTCQSYLNTEKANCEKLRGDFVVSQVGIRPKRIVHVVEWHLFHAGPS